MRRSAGGYLDLFSADPHEAVLDMFLAFNQDEAFNADA